MEQEVKRIDRKHILFRISNWKKRLNILFSHIDDWAKDLKGIRIQQSSITQAREELMHKFDIEPNTVPTMAIFYGKHRVSFVPMGLWVIGSNGRINITTNTNQYILVDLGGDDDEPSQWTIVNPAKRKEKISFDEKTLAKIIEDKDIFL
jgi:hypothetical protein